MKNKTMEKTNKKDKKVAHKMKKVIITYGTLRKEGVLYKSFLGEKKSRYLWGGKIKGFDLYDLGSYPAVIKGNGEVVIEVFEVSEEIFKAIERMEKSSGYSQKEVIVNKIKGTIWFFDKEILKRYRRAKKIEHGDYIKFTTDLKEGKR